MQNNSLHFVPRLDDHFQCWLLPKRKIGKIVKMGKMGYMVKMGKMGKMG
jgi:hypothetical protein